MGYYVCLIPPDGCCLCDNFMDDAIMKVITQSKQLQLDYACTNCIEIFGSP